MQMIFCPHCRCALSLNVSPDPTPEPDRTPVPPCVGETVRAVKPLTYGTGLRIERGTTGRVVRVRRADHSVDVEWHGYEASPHETDVDGLRVVV